MPIDIILQYYVAHVSSVIVWLIVISLGLVAFYLLLSLRDEKMQVNDGQTHFVNLEETLKKVLESASHLGGRESIPRVLEVPPAPEPPRPKVAGDDSSRLAAELEIKIKRIKDLEALLASARAEAAARPAVPTDAADSKTPEHEAKIRSLEAKLAEYQVVEDDIANLSLYREENVKLKDELEKLRASAGIPNPPTATLKADEKSDDLAEFEAALNAQEKSASEPTPVLAVSDAATPAEDDLMSEFESVVKAQKQSDVSASSNAEIARAVEAPMDQDLMGDFESAVRTNVTGSPTAPAVTTTVTGAPAVTTESPTIIAGAAAAPAEAPIMVAEPKAPPALAIQLDTDQMVSEVNGFKPPADPGTTDLNDGDRLIAEFENFVKSEGESS
jgi:hypothetical protein